MTQSTEEASSLLLNGGSAPSDDITLFIEKISKENTKAYGTSTPLVDVSNLHNHPKSEGLTTAEANRLLKQYGKNELPEKVVSKWYLFFSQLWQPMPVMIWIAAAVEIVLRNYMDAGILLAINIINASLSFYETTKAGDAVAALKASLKPTAMCMRMFKVI